MAALGPIGAGPAGLALFFGACQSLPLAPRYGLKKLDKKKPRRRQGL